ncbi:MAG: BatA domain-containing protein [Planctomycetota bacterium]|nr:BatA domain-containing protein [Planctomycetota bacterium]
MMLGLGFVTPWLLAGLAAAAIPFVIHLLASVRAKEVRFPTLRFLRMSMEKTARRRRIQHWLLLLLRAAALALLAMAAAEPFQNAVGGWQAGQRHAAVIVLDNSLSMSVKREEGTCLDIAKRQADNILGADDAPALAAVAATNGRTGQVQLSADLEALRKAVRAVAPSAGRAALPGLVEQAAGVLAKADCPKKTIYLLGDVQKISYEELATARELARAEGVYLLVVDVGQQGAANAAVTDVEISPERLANQPVGFKATVTNASPRARQVRVVLRGQGGQSEPVTKDLAAAGSAGDSGTVWLSRTFARAGEVTGDVAILDDDDLNEDNARRFHITVAPAARALVVGGPGDPNDSPKLSPTWCLEASLSPWAAGEKAWPIERRTVAAAGMADNDVAWADIVFLSNVPALTETQTRTIERFVKGGGTLVVAMGPDVNVAAYNRLLAPAGLLPGELGEAVGQVGADADAMAVTAIDVEHPYLAGFYASASEFPRVLVWRHVPLRAAGANVRTLLALPGGRAILTVHPLGDGRVVCCTTTASPKWSDLAVRLGPPMWIRMTLSAPRTMRSPESYPPGETVEIRPGAGAGAERVSVTLPAERTGATAAVENATVRMTERGAVATFRNTTKAGVYAWRAEGKGSDRETPSGEFVVNAPGAESRLAKFDAGEFVAMMRAKGFARVYAGASVDQVHRAVEADSEPVPWWDRVAAAVILLLVGEAMAANLRRSRERAL